MSGHSVIHLPCVFHDAELLAGEVDEEVASIISGLASRVSAPEYVRTPQFARKSRRHTRSTKETAWSGTKMSCEPVPGFKATVIRKRSGALGLLDRIRKHINKMSPKTYETLRDKAFNEFEGELPSEESEKLSEDLFDLLSTNGFYGELYSRFYAEMLARYPSMRTVLASKLKEASSALVHVDYCDPVKDYDGFCINNRNNAGSRAACSFYVHLVDRGVIEQDDAVGLVRELQLNIAKEMDSSSACFVRDELAERIYAMLSCPAARLLVNEDRWKDVVDGLSAYSRKAPNLEKGFTAKSVFRHQDILDMLRSRKLV